MSAETYVRIDGEGQALVLVHGVGLDHTMWDPAMPMLAAERMVVRYDLLGHGRSHDPDGPRHLDDFVGQAMAVLTALDTGPCDIAGLSLGAMIAGAVASRHPDRVRKVALLSAVFERTPDDIAAAEARLAGVEEAGMTAMVRSAIDRWFSAAWQVEHPEAVESVATVLLANGVEAYAKAYRVFLDGDERMPDAAEAIAAHTLVMTGKLDVGSTPAMSRGLAARIPNAGLRILDSLHHVPPIEAPRTFAAALLDFFEG